MPLPEQETLEKLRVSLMDAWMINDENDWPIKLNTISHLFSREFFIDLYETMETLREGDYSLKQISAAFKNPSRIYRSIDLILKGMYLNACPLTIRRRTILNLIECIGYLKNGSVFNEDGRNIILDDKQVKLLTGQPGFASADQDTAREIHELIALIRAYIETLYFRMYDISQEIHGPYQTGLSGNRALLIRDFNNLRPLNLWPSSLFPPVDSLSILTEYDAKIKVTFDVHNHIYNDGAHFIHHLRRWKIIADGKDILKRQDVLRLTALLKGLILQNYSALADWQWQDAAKKYAEIAWQKISDLKDIARVPPSVPEQVFANIDRGELAARDESIFVDRPRLMKLMKMLI